MNPRDTVRERPSDAGADDRPRRRSAPAAARSPTSIPQAAFTSGRAPRAPSPARRATAKAARSRPSPTRRSCSAASTPTRCSAATCRSIPTSRTRPSKPRWRSRSACRSRTPRSASSRSSTRTWRWPSRSNSVARGIDPREFALVPFGGAGPLHGVALAEAIAAKEIIVPVAPGITAAIGLLQTDMQYEHARSLIVSLKHVDQAAIARINAVIDELVERCRRDLEKDGVKPERAEIPEARGMPLSRARIRAAGKSSGRQGHRGESGRRGHQAFTSSTASTTATISMTARSS